MNEHMSSESSPRSRAQPASSSQPERLSAEELFKGYAKFVARFLVHLGVSTRDLDDVVQEVFLVVHARGGYVAGPAKPTSYLGSIAVRAAHSYRRRQNTQRSRASQDSPDELESDSLGPVEQIESDENARKIRAALATLPEELRAPLLLVELEGESCGSVAASTNSPVGTVYWRLHNARKQFRKALAAQEQHAQPAATGLEKGWRS
jgi:RNA polymerase sigma-70 factor (ECF subfamily)